MLEKTQDTEESTRGESPRPATRTRSRLRVQAELDQGSYPLGVRVSDRELAAVPLQRHGWHGDWNYTVLPATA